MVQLIITIFAIALTAAIVVASVNYLPWWYRTANITEESLIKTMSVLEQTYDVAVRAADGVAPAVIETDADRGLMANFGDLLKFTPLAPSGYTWTYGVHGDDGSRYANLGYFCLKPVGEGASEGVARGIMRTRNAYSPEQVVVASTCGANSSDPTPSEYPAPLHVTMYVVYTPGVSR